MITKGGNRAVTMNIERVGSRKSGTSRSASRNKRQDNLEQVQRDKFPSCDDIGNEAKQLPPQHMWTFRELTQEKKNTSILQKAEAYATYLTETHPNWAPRTENERQKMQK